MSVWAYTSIMPQVKERPEENVRPPWWVLQAVVRNLTCVLGTKPRSCRRVVGVPNSWAFSSPLEVVCTSHLHLLLLTLVGFKLYVKLSEQNDFCDILDFLNLSSNRIQDVSNCKIQGDNTGSWWTLVGYYILKWNKSRILILVFTIPLTHCDQK